MFCNEKRASPAASMKFTSSPDRTVITAARGSISVVDRVHFLLLTQHNVCQTNAVALDSNLLRTKYGFSSVALVHSCDWRASTSAYFSHFCTRDSAAEWAC